MYIIGLTGSIGMGKSTTAQLFAQEGVPVHDADAAVHALYEGAAVPLIEGEFPGTTRNGKVDRSALARAVLDNDGALKKLEGIVHPLVRQSEESFLRDAAAKGAAIVVLDIPLLFETGGDRRVDAVVVVSAPEEVQRQRVLSRPGMTAEKFEQLKSRQVPDSEKRKRADFIVESGEGLEVARKQVKDILRKVAKLSEQPK